MLLREGYTVDTVFIERGESARSIDRPVFRDMLAYCRKRKDSIDAVVVYALTRFWMKIATSSGQPASAAGA